MIEDEKSLICISCRQLYTKKERCPRRLLCGHTFCTSCLAILIETKNRKCPSCLRPFLASSETQLPTDFAVYKKIAYGSPEIETDSQKISANNKSTLNSPVQVNEPRNEHITPSKNQFQFPGHLDNLTTHHQDEAKSVNNRMIASPTPFKFQLPLIARSSSTMVRLPPYTGLGGNDEVDAPRERIHVEDISQEDIQAIPPPASAMDPLPPIPISQLPQQTPITQRSSSNQDASIYQSMQTESLTTDIPKESQETFGFLQLPTPSVRTNVQSHPTSQTPGIKATFSEELPKPIKRSVTTLSPPIPAVRSSLTQQLTTKSNEKANKIPDATKNPTYSDSGRQLLINVSSPTQLPPTALTSANTDIYDSGNSNKTPTYSSLKQTQSANWKPLSTSSPLSWEKTKLSFEEQAARNTSERLPTTQKTTTDSVSKDLSGSDGQAMSKRTAKRPAPNPKPLKIDPVFVSTPSKGAQQLPNSNADKSPLRASRTSKLSIKQRAPSPKPVAAYLPTINSPLPYRPLTGISVKSGALDSQKLTAQGAVLKKQNAKRKAPNPALQEKSAKQELSLYKRTPISSYKLQEHTPSSAQIKQDQNNILDNGDEISSSQHIQPGQRNSDLLISDRNQLPDAIVETSTAKEIQSPQESNIPAASQPLIAAASKTPQTTITETINEIVRTPTPPSPSTIPVSSDDDKKDLNDSSVNSPSTANESVRRTNKPEMRDDSQGSKLVYKFGLGPVPFKSRATDEDSTNSIITSDSKKTGHSQYMSRIQRGELQVGEVPSVQEFENDRNLANTPKLKEEQKSSSLDTPRDSGIYNNDQLKTEETSKPVKLPEVAHQTSTKPIKRYISPLTKNVHISGSHDSVKQDQFSIIAKKESLTLKDPHVNNESFTISEGNEESYPQSSKTEKDMSKGKSKSSKQAKSKYSGNSSDENLKQDLSYNECVYTDTDTEEQNKMKQNYPKHSSEKENQKAEEPRSSSSCKHHSRKHSNQNSIIQDKGTGKLQPELNRSRDMKSEVFKSHRKLAVKSDKHFRDDYDEASLSTMEEQSDDQTKSSEKYHKHVESKSDSKYSSNEDTDHRPKSSKHKVLTKKYVEQQRRSNSAPKRKTNSKSNDNNLYKNQTEKHKQHKRSQLKRDIMKLSSFKYKQEYWNEEEKSNTGDINLKLQRARQRLKSTLDEPKSASSYKETKTRQGKTTVPSYLTRRNKDSNHWGQEFQESSVKDYYGSKSDEEQSDGHSDISERRRMSNYKEEHSDTESDTRVTASQGEMEINSKGMIVRYPTRYKFPQSQIKNTTQTTLRTRNQKKYHGQKNLVEQSDVENDFTESADEIEINSKGMIMRHPSANRRQPSQTQNETRAVNSDIKKMHKGKSRRNHKIHYPQTESGETSGNDKSSKTHKGNDGNTSDVNLLLQRARHSLKSTLVDKDPEELAKSYHTQNKLEKKASLLKEKSDFDGERTNHKKRKSRTGKENRARSNESKLRGRESPIDSYPLSRTYDTSHDMYKYDERIPKRFYSRVNLKPSIQRSFQDWRNNDQPVINPTFKSAEESVSESENQDSAAYPGSSKYEAHKRLKDAIMPKYHGLEGNASVSSEEFPTDIYADFKPDNYNSNALSSNDDSEMTIDTTRRKVTKNSVTKSNSFLKRKLALTDSQYKSSFHYRPSSQIYTAELALVTNPEDGKTDNVMDLGKEMRKMGVGQCKTHGALMDLYCKTCELWVCRECLDVVHRPPPEGHCQTISSDQAVEELKESHTELFDAKIATLEHFKEELQKLLENCETSIKDHEVSVAQLSSRVLSEKMIIQGIENMKTLVQQKWKQVEQWEDVLEANALRIGQSASSGEIVDAMERNKSEILVHVMQGMTGEHVPNQTTNRNFW